MKQKIAALAAMVTLCVPVWAQQAPQDTIGMLTRAFHESGQFQGAIRSEIEGEIRTDLAFGLADQAAAIANTTDTQFYVASISKAFTAVLALQQVEAGRLELDASIAPYFPGLKAEIADHVTLRHLLTHTSGVTRDYTEALSGGAERTPSDLIDALNASTLLFEPGSRSDYSNTGYHMIARMLEQATGQTYAQLLEKHITSITGMENTTFGPQENAARGYESDDLLTLQPVPMERANPPSLFGAGGIFSTTGDLSRFMRAVADGVLLTPEMMQLMLGESETENGNGAELMGWSAYQAPDGGRIIAADGAADGYLSLITWLENSPSTRLVMLANDTRMGRRGFGALTTGTLMITFGADVPIEAPLTPVYTFLQTLLADGEDAALAYADALDWSQPTVASAAASQATGAPDGGVGETDYAWAPATADAGAEWLTLGWDAPIRARAVQVQFTQVPGVLTAVDAGMGQIPVERLAISRSLSGDGAPVELYTFETSRSVNELTLHMNTADIAGWPQIDAVGLVDDTGVVHWSETARASSSAFDAGGVAMQDLPGAAILGKLARRLTESGQLEEAQQIRHILPRLNH